MVFAADALVYVTALLMTFRSHCHFGNVFNLQGRKERKITPQAESYLVLFKGGWEMRDFFLS